MKKQIQKSAYSWEEVGARGRVAVTAVTAQAQQIAARLTDQHSRRQSVFWLSRAQFQTFKGEFAKICQHPPARNYSWLVDTTIYTGCRDCGTILLQKDLARRNPNLERKGFLK